MMLILALLAGILQGALATLFFLRARGRKMIAEIEAEEDDELCISPAEVDVAGDGPLWIRELVAAAHLFDAYVTTKSQSETLRVLSGLVARRAFVDGWDIVAAGKATDRTRGGFYIFKTWNCDPLAMGGLATIIINEADSQMDEVS